MRKAFTLMELIIVVIVIGVLATFAVPQFLTSVEKAKVAKAKNAMGLIAQAEKMHRAERDLYLAVAADGANASLLGGYVELDQVDADADWQYVVAALTAITDDFQITATRSAGLAAYNGTTIILDDDGTCAGDHPLRGPACGG